MGATDQDKLSRRLGLSDAITLGLGAMIGAGVFAAPGPASQAAGSGILLALLAAAFVAFCNATSSAQLAALHPQSGGTYVYGRIRLGDLWGYLAGFGFVIGKMASCAAMALTFGAYAAPGYERPLAIGAVVLLTAINLRGVQKTAFATRVILGVVLASLLVAVAAMLLGGSLDASHLLPLTGGMGPKGILEGAGLLFFAFAGYARIATLGEEVVEPRKTIPRAISTALATALAVYALIIVSVLLAAGPAALAASRAPLATAVEAGRFAALSPVVRVGATLASLGALLSLIVGVSRTAFAMARNGDLPGWLAAVHKIHRVPHRAELAVGVIVAAAVALADLRHAIGFSSFAVLLYYAVTNASALRLSAEERIWPRWIAWAGLVGCVVLAGSLPIASILAGLGLFTVGLLVWMIRRRSRGASSAL